MKTETPFKSETLSGSLNFQELSSMRPDLEEEREEALYSNATFQSS